MLYLRTTLLRIFKFVSVPPHVCSFPWRSEEGIESLRAVVTEGCELFGIRAGNQIHALSKSQSFLSTEPSLKPLESQILK